jgi:hypothetical protein
MESQLVLPSFCRTSGNSFSNGPAPPPPPGTTPAPQRPAVPSSNGSSVSSDSGSKHSKLQGGAIAGIVICLLVVGAMVTFFVIKRKSWKLSLRRDPEQNEPLSPLASGFKRKRYCLLRVLQVHLTTVLLPRNKLFNLPFPMN